MSASATQGGHKKVYLFSTGKLHSHRELVWLQFMFKVAAVCKLVSQLVSWSLTSLFSTNTAISETKGQGWKVIRTQ